MVCLRRATLSDAEKMAEVHARSWESAYAGLLPTEIIAATSARRPLLWQRILEEPGGHEKYAVCEGDKIVGLLVISTSRDEGAPPGAFEVVSLYLLPEHFGKGYGGEAMRYACERAAELGYHAVTLWVLEDNTRARKIYEKHGFRFDGTRKEIVIGVPKIEIRYRRDLSPSV